MVGCTEFFISSSEQKMGHLKLVLYVSSGLPPFVI